MNFGKKFDAIIKICFQGMLEWQKSFSLSMKMTRQPVNKTWDNEKNMTHKNHEISKNYDLNINLCILSARACSARLKDIETIFRKQNWQSSLFFRGSARWECFAPHLTDACQKWVHQVLLSIYEFLEVRTISPPACAPVCVYLSAAVCPRLFVCVQLSASIRLCLPAFIFYWLGRLTVSLVSARRIR